MGSWVRAAVRVGLAALVVGGCSGGEDDDDPEVVPPLQDDDDDDNGGDDDDDDDTALFVDAVFYAVTGRFGFDPELMQHVGFAHPGEGMSPLQIGVLLIDSSFQSTGVVDETNSCEVRLTTPGPEGVAPWVPTAGGWVGFDLPPRPDVDDGCADYLLPSVFAGDPGALLSEFRWGIGVGPLLPEVRQALQTYMPVSEWAGLEPFALGALLRADVMDAAYGDPLSISGYSVANEVDGNFEIVVGGTGDPHPIPADEVPLGTGGVIRGFYEVKLGPFLAAPLSQVSQ